MKFNSLIPELSVSDLGQSLKFYRDTLGFKAEYDRPLEKFSFLSLGSVQIMIEQNNGNWQTSALSYPYGRGINFQMEVQDVDALVKKIRGAGIHFFREPETVEYKTFEGIVAQKQFLVLDPDGYLLRFCQRML
jgi:catechol 2,3-dioxygenase-like lactoylglutathione lyase family enzyme